jgi:RND family efflux transporter MFP subunit
MKRIIGWLIVFLLLGSVAFAVYAKVSSGARGAADRPSLPAPVAVETIERGTAIARRRFAGSLEPSESFLAASKISGRVEALFVDIGDTVERGQVLARLDSEELRLQVEEQRAAVQVAEATLAESIKAEEIAGREYERISSLAGGNIATQSSLDATRLELDAAQSRVLVARSQLAQRQASLRSAEVRLDYAEVRADWEGEDRTRVVGERFVNQGDTVGANDQLVSILEIDTLRVVVSVTERDYPRLRVGQMARLHADPYPDESFDARIVRLAPIFQTSSRQARVEAVVANNDRRLKPGMFVTLEVELGRADDVPLVPTAAIVTREEREGVFLLSPTRDSVSFVAVKTGIEEGSRVEVVSPADLAGEVVVLGQHLVSDGAPVNVGNGSGGNG